MNLLSLHTFTLTASDQTLKCLLNLYFNVISIFSFFLCVACLLIIHYLYLILSFFWRHFWKKTCYLVKNKLLNKGEASNYLVWLIDCDVRCVPNCIFWTYHFDCISSQNGFIFINRWKSSVLIADPEQSKNWVCNGGHFTPSPNAILVM